jgi:predicted dehydrogenase
MSGKVRVGVIGAGRIGRVHTAHLAHRIPEVEIVAICDVVTAAAEKMRGGFRHPDRREGHACPLGQG